MLIGSLPLLLKFEMATDFMVKDWFLKKLEDDHNVNISIKARIKKKCLPHPSSNKVTVT